MRTQEIIDSHFPVLHFPVPVLPTGKCRTGKCEPGSQNSGDLVNLSRREAKMAQTNFPENWKMTKLGDLGEISGGGTPSTKISEYWNGDIPWLVPGEVTRNDGL